MDLHGTQKRASLGGRVPVIGTVVPARTGRRGNSELGTVEFRAEFFNVFNLVNFGLPSNILRGSGFGVISKTAGPSRQIQFSLKLIY